MRRRRADAGLGSPPLGGRTSACDPTALGGALCGQQGGPDLKHSANTDPHYQSSGQLDMTENLVGSTTTRMALSH